MGENTKIEWTDHTFSPWEGCTKVSPGCTNCYAEARNHRWGMDNWGKGKPRRRTSEGNWRKPVAWNRRPWICECCGRSDDKYYDHSCTGRPEDARHTSQVKWHRARVFCASLADWLDDEVPIEWLADLLKLIHDTPNLDWLLLTKRPENWRERIEAVSAYVCDSDHEGREDAAWLASKWASGTPPANIWIGTTCEDQTRADQRIPELLKIPARVRFLSCEPLLGPVEFSDVTKRADGVSRLGKSALEGIHWVIAGGESGPSARAMHPDWARSLRDQCQSAGVPFLFKQWGEWIEFDTDGALKEVDAESEFASILAPLCDGFLSHSGLFAKSLSALRDNTTYRGMVRVGKKSAGRLLDGREWNEFPNP